MEIVTIIKSLSQSTFPLQHFKSSAGKYWLRFLLIPNIITKLLPTLFVLFDQFSNLSFISNGLFTRKLFLRK